MKHKVSELSGALLDAAVAKAEGHSEIEVSSFTRHDGQRLRCEVVLPGEDGQTYWTEYRPSADWEVAGPIIERDLIALDWRADLHNMVVTWTGVVMLMDSTRVTAQGPTPLIAAMRAYVASKFGDVVELP